jgi:hypothetical protein
MKKRDTEFKAEVENGASICRSIRSRSWAKAAKKRSRNAGILIGVALSMVP